MESAFPNYRVLDEYYIGEGLYLDIYLPDFMVGIEINGKQHYEFSPFFHTDAAGWADQKRRDKRKAEICERKGIKLAVFKYDEPVNDVVFVFGRICEAQEDSE